MILHWRLSRRISPFVDRLQPAIYLKLTSERERGRERELQTPAYGDKKDVFVKDFLQRATVQTLHSNLFELKSSVCSTRARTESMSTSSLFSKIFEVFRRSCQAREGGIMMWVLDALDSKEFRF